MPFIFEILASPVSSVAVCAGSGSSVLNGVAADLFVTGEMSHHEVLVRLLQPILLKKFQRCVKLLFLVASYSAASFLFESQQVQVKKRLPPKDYESIFLINPVM